MVYHFICCCVVVDHSERTLWLTTVRWSSRVTSVESCSAWAMLVASVKIPPIPISIPSGDFCDREFQWYPFDDSHMKWPDRFGNWEATFKIWMSSAVSCWKCKKIRSRRTQSCFNLLKQELIFYSSRKTDSTTFVPIHIEFLIALKRTVTV